MTPEVWVGLFMLLALAPWLCAWSMRIGAEALREEEREEEE